MYISITIFTIFIYIKVCLYMCVYTVRNPGTVHRHTPVPEYSVPMTNPKRNSKL